MRRRSDGFSRSEFATAVIVVLLAVLLAVTLSKFLGGAERQRVENDIRDMQTFLNLKLLDLTLSGEKAEIEQLIGSNPALLLERLPKDYHGEVDKLSLADETGWIFDRGTRQLVYRPSSFSFPYRAEENRELRWQLQRNAGSDRSVRLARLQPSLGAGFGSLPRQ